MNNQEKRTVKKMNGLCLLVTALLILGHCYGQQASTYNKNIRPSFPQAGTVKVMTFNIRANNVLEGLYKWPFRKQVIFDILTDNGADVIGLQEARHSQLQDIQQVLKQYNCYAAGRSDGLQSGESCPIFYRKDRFTLLDSGTFWFSDTPRASGTKDWGNIVPRICSWVHLREKGQGTGFYVYNLHLDAFSQNSREKSVRLLAKQVFGRKTKDPFVVTGDFNMKLDNSAMKYLMKFGYQSPYPKMVDAWMSVHPDQSEVSTCQAVGGLIAGPQIDHIQLCENTTALEVTIDSRKLNEHYASDHYPVIAKIQITRPAQVARLDGKKNSIANTALD
jgi:endonuclease/exonuclease/phosphatase family metal-dependent hydrolase